MQKIKKYVENFFKTNARNVRYQIYVSEMEACKDAMKVDPFGTICTLFNYGYAKGYRAALSEVKKGGEMA